MTMEMATPEAPAGARTATGHSASAPRWPRHRVSGADAGPCEIASCATCTTPGTNRQADRGHRERQRLSRPDTGRGPAAGAPAGAGARTGAQGRARPSGGAAMRADVAPCAGRRRDHGDGGSGCKPTGRRPTGADVCLTKALPA